MKNITTAFEFKDDRVYVNSSTMCEFLSSQVVPAIGLQNSEIRLDAKFHRLSNKNGIMRCQETPDESSAVSEIAAEFRLVSDSRNYYVYFLEGQEPVAKRISSRYEIKNLKLLSEYAGSCRIMISDIRSLIENTIEANKRLHQATFPQKEIKVINLYMKRFPLGPVPERKGWNTLDIRHIGSRNHNNGFATLNSFSFAELGIPAFEMCYFLPGVGL